MFQYLAQAADKPWQPGPYAGVELKILHKNEATGGLVVLRKFAPGTNVPAHTHPVANEWAYILSGEWVESDLTYGPGTLFHAPKGEIHCSSHRSATHRWKSEGARNVIPRALRCVNW